MNRKLILLNVLLIGVLAALAWQLRVRWVQAKQHEREMLQRKAEVRAQIAPPPAAPIKPVAAVEYVNVAQQMLFAQDRNPNIVLPPPPPPKPDPPVPPMPFYHGQMKWGDPVVYLSTGNGEQKRYHVGEKVGPFEVVSFDTEKIVFKWEEKTIEKKVSDLKPKENVQAQQAVNAPAPTPAPAQANGGAISLSSLSSTASDDKNPSLGVDMGAGFRGCVTGENSPAGTVLNGYKKVIATTMMGRSCHWEPVNK